MWGKVQTSTGAWQAGQIQNKKHSCCLGSPLKCYGISLIWQQLTQLSLSWLLVSLHTQVTKVRIKTLPLSVYTVITQNSYTHLVQGRQTRTAVTHSPPCGQTLFTDSQRRADRHTDHHADRRTNSSLHTLFERCKHMKGSK